MEWERSGTMNDNLAYQDDYVIEEMIDGKVYLMSPPPASRHIFVAGNIYKVFSYYLEGKKCKAIPDGMALFITDKDYFVPDFMIVCNPDIIQEDGVHGAPDLVVEVLSPSTAQNDRSRKMKVYERCGVKEYWIVDPANKMVEVYLLRDGAYVWESTYILYPDYIWKHMKEEERAAVVTEFKCSLFDDLTIRLEEIFDGI